MSYKSCNDHVIIIMYMYSNMEFHVVVQSTATSNYNHDNKNLHFSGVELRILQQITVIKHL